jgi:creatinine amidohydrolase
MDRRVLQAITVTMYMALILAVLFPAALGAQSTPAQTENPAKGGYSIFHETIVDMPWPDVEKAAKAGAIILVPTAVIEQHGPHMDLGVDTYLSYLRAKMVRRELEARGIRTIVTPPFYWGINVVSGAFPGSFTSRPDVMKEMVLDIVTALDKWGFKKIFVLNWHGDALHNLTILKALEQAQTGGISAYYVTTPFYAGRFGLTGKEKHAVIENTPSPAGPPPKYLAVHAEQQETALMAYYYPEHVDTAMAKTLKPTNLGIKELTEWRKGFEVARKITPQGYFGDPAAFDKEEERAKFEASARSAALAIEGVVKGTYKAPALGK